MIIILKLVFISFCYNQGFNSNINEYEKVQFEIESIKNNREDESLYIFPNISKRRSISRLNLLNKFGNNLKLEPVFAFRYSNAGFELYPNITPSDLVWISPGFKFSGDLPIFYSFTSTWLHFWVDFYKHSSYSFQNKEINSFEKLFEFNPKYSIEYYRVDQSINAIEFDQSQGGIALLSPKFSLILGKMKLNLGPFFRDNLSISKSTPSFQQIRLNKKFLKNDKELLFTYIFGSLYSSILDSSLQSLYIDVNQNKRTPNLSRYIALHRFDFKFKSNFRIGFYEKIIFGGRDIPIEYLNPLMPFWSAQHSLGDLDNLIMGLDFTYIYKKSRLIGAFFMDEVDPYKIFDNKNRNWFGYQLGFSYLPLFFNDKLLFKSEYTKLDPRVYNHRYDINYPTHHNYNLGFFTGGHSQDIWFSLYYFFNDLMHINISYEKTIIGEQDISKQYNDEQIDFLKGNLNKRNVYTLEIFKKIPLNINMIFNIKSFETLNLGYKRNKFYETSISFLYNLHY